MSHNASPSASSALSIDAFATDVANGAGRSDTTNFTPRPDRARTTTELVTEAGAHAQALSRKGSE
jgi:hypothetical protein